MPLPLPALVPGLRRPRDEDDINNLGERYKLISVKRMLTLSARITSTA